MEIFITGFIIGTVLGSFCGAVADRLNKNQTILGRSKCNSCKKEIAPYDLVPAVSYLILKGRCRRCGKQIPSMDLLVELGVGVVVGLLLLKFSVLDPLALMFVLFVVCVAAVVFLTDLKTGLIYDKITYPAIAAILFFHLMNLIELGLATKGESLRGYGGFLVANIVDYLIGGLGAAGFFALLILITKGRGMGWGDVKYVLFLGLVFGFPMIVLVLFLSFLFGSVFSIGLILLGKKSFGQTVPFGPFLSLGALFSLLYGPELMGWYLGNLYY